MLHLSELIKLARLNLFDIATQYQAVFTSPSAGNADTSCAALFNLPEVSNFRILPSWLTYKMEIILNYIKKDLTDALSFDPTAPVESVKNSILFFGESMSRIGMELRPRLLIILNEVLKEKMIKNPASIDSSVKTTSTSGLTEETIDLAAPMTTNNDPGFSDGWRSPSKDSSSATGSEKMVQSIIVKEAKPKLKVDATDELSGELYVISLQNETEGDVDDANDDSNPIMIEENERPLGSPHFGENVETTPMTKSLNLSLSSEITCQGEELPTNCMSQQVGKVIEETKYSDDLQSD